MVVSVGGLVAVAVCEGEVTLGEVRRSSNLVCAVRLLLHIGQHVVSLLEVINDLTEQLFVRKLVVACLFLKFVLCDVLVYPRHLTEHGDELEVEVCAEELHLSHTLLRHFRTKLAVAILLKREQCAVAAAHSAIEAIPEFVKLAGRGSHCRPYLHGMIACIGGS